MTDFRADCTINLHVATRASKRGKAASRAWVCSIQHPKHGRLVLAQKKMGMVSREEAELAALLFGLQQAARFLQEKVEVAATFGVEDRLASANSTRLEGAGALTSGGDSLLSPNVRLARAWSKFRLKRVVRMRAEEAKFLADSAQRSLGHEE